MITSEGLKRPGTIRESSQFFFVLGQITNLNFKFIVRLVGLDPGSEAARAGPESQQQTVQSPVAGLFRQPDSSLPARFGLPPP